MTGGDDQKIAELTKAFEDAILHDLNLELNESFSVALH